MSKKEDEKIVTWILIIIILPIILVYFLIKYIIWFISFLAGNDNSFKYKLKLSTNEKEQLNIIDNMSGIEFEKFMCAMLTKNGYTNVKMTKASGDHGADILAEYNNEKYAFQCKRFESKVSSKPIGEVLRGINYYNCNNGVVITNNYFTKQAMDEAKVNNVELWDRDKIIKLYRNVLNKNDNIKNEIKIIEILKNNKIKIITIIIFLIVAFFVGNYINEFKNDMESDENRISVYKLDNDIYNIAKDNLNMREFKEVINNKGKIEFIIKYTDYDYKYYDKLFKEEITKIYNQIKDKELKWRTFFGFKDEIIEEVEFVLSYEGKDEYDNKLGRIILRYTNDKKWTKSYEEEINKEIVTQKSVEKMQQQIK